jgi:shikimate kinase
MPSRCRIPRSSRISSVLPADKIYLVGFMGAGKSSVARALGKRLDWKVEDIDARIERTERRDIPTIFRIEGEPYFRAREREALISLLPERGTVVASGGGTFADASNRELMLRDGAVIWLDAPLETVLKRIPLDGRRPLAADRVGMEQLYNQRLAAYRLAHLRVDAGRGSVEELVDHIVEWLEAN